MRISFGTVSMAACVMFLLLFLGQPMFLHADDRADILQKVRELVSNGQGDHAMPVLNRRLQANPDDTDFLLLRSAARLEMGQMDTALADAKKAVTASNNHVEAHCHLAAILLRNGQYDEAAPLLQRAIELDPSFFLARMNMASCYKLQGKPLEALTELDAALQINSNSPDALLFRARLRKEHGDRAGAEADFVLAAQSVPEGLDRSIQEEIATIRSERARLGDDKAFVSPKAEAQQSDASQEGRRLLAEKKPAAARDAFARAIVRHGESVELLLLRCLALSQLGDSAGAQKDAERAVALNPNHAPAYVQLGGLLGRQGRLEDAVAAFAQALRLDPANLDYQRRLQGARDLLAGQGKAAKRPDTDADGLLQLSQTAIEFRNVARFDYFVAIAQYASADVQKMFAKYDEQIWPVAHPEDGWAYFFDGSIICMGSLNLAKELVVAYYHPWSEVFLITVWKQVSGQKPQIVDAEVLMADFIIKAGKPPFAAARFWLREKNQFRPFLAGMSAARSLLAFESTFRRDAAGRASWRSAFPSLAKTAAAEAVREKNRYGAGLMLAANLKEILDASVVEPQGAVAAAYRNSWASFQKSLEDGGAGAAAQRSAGTLPETKQVLAQLNDDVWRQFRLVSYIPTQSACLAMLSRADKPDQYLSLLFKPQGAQAVLDRVDLMSFQAMHALLSSQEANQ